MHLIFLISVHHHLWDPAAHALCPSRKRRGIDAESPV